MQHPLSPHGNNQRIQPIVFTAGPVDIEYLDHIGHNTELIVEIPVETQGQVCFPAADYILVGEVHVTGPDGKLKSASSTPE